MTCEIFHIIGLGLLAFKILPELDVVKGAMLTNSVCLVPALLSILRQNVFGVIKFNLKTLAQIFSAKAHEGIVKQICVIIFSIFLQYVLS